MGAERESRGLPYTPREAMCIDWLRPVSGLLTNSHSVAEGYPALDPLRSVQFRSGCDGSGCYSRKVALSSSTTFSSGQTRRCTHARSAMGRYYVTLLRFIHAMPHYGRFMIGHLSWAYRTSQILLEDWPISCVIFSATVRRARRSLERACRDNHK